MNIFRSDFKKNPRTIFQLLNQLMEGIGSRIKDAIPDDAKDPRRAHRWRSGDALRRRRARNQMARESRRINFAKARGW